MPLVAEGILLTASELNFNNLLSSDRQNETIDFSKNKSRYFGKKKKIIEIVDRKNALYV